MPAGLSKMNIQEEASSGGDAVGHLLCRGGRFMMDGSSKYCYVFIGRGLICLIYPWYLKAMPHIPHWVPKMTPRMNGYHCAPVTLG